jgi:hypothetical protein
VVIAEERSQELVPKKGMLPGLSRVRLGFTAQIFSPGLICSCHTQAKKEKIMKSRTFSTALITLLTLFASFLLESMMVPFSGSHHFPSLDSVRLNDPGSRTQSEVGDAI